LFFCDKYAGKIVCIIICELSHSSFCVLNFTLPAAEVAHST